jgi:hypothetical protein
LRVRFDAAVFATDLISLGSEYGWEFEVGSLFLFKYLQHEINRDYAYKLGFYFTEDKPRWVIKSVCPTYWGKLWLV